ncbi:hypothetical protein DAPPUDRAFT_233592 [Daphnia pulex]|uniref:Uncharacterized protein n=1 Tax=Daphnia pulex TaxID=6669 RepID=E9FV74_DAPPU|nr:hypothetical protein DAPPUDRAFT_233592 [Daphnia pulex]|eukprot:EFX88507.1 hypothetical protein DAPPUDRAFT_233592 [Daphnia pulex]
MPLYRSPSFPNNVPYTDSPRLGAANLISLLHQRPKNNNEAFRSWIETFVTVCAVSRPDPQLVCRNVQNLPSRARGGTPVSFSVNSTILLLKMSCVSSIGPERAAAAAASSLAHSAKVGATVGPPVKRRKNNIVAKGKASKKKTGKHSGDVQGENLEIGLMSSELTMHTHDAVCTYQPVSTTAMIDRSPGHSGQRLPLSSQFMSYEYDKMVNTDQGNSIIYSTVHCNLHNYQLYVRGAVRVEIGLAARRSKIGWLPLLFSYKPTTFLTLPPVAYVEPYQVGRIKNGHD